MVRLGTTVNFLLTPHEVKGRTYKILIIHLSIHVVLLSGPP